MTEQVRQTETSGKVKAVSVADYVVERLAAEGIAFETSFQNGFAVAGSGQRDVRGSVIFTGAQVRPGNSWV